MTRFGNTPLHGAIHTGRKTIVAMLLANHADIDAPGVIELASENKQMVKVFKQHLSRVLSSCFVPILRASHILLTVARWSEEVSQSICLT
jgi:GTPase involved in cell partitioning and DNA repair